MAVIAAFLGSECQKFKIISFWENLPIPNHISVSGQVSAAFEGYKGAIPLSSLCHPLNRSFPSARLLRQDLLCARRRGAAVSQPCRQQHLILPPSSTQIRYLPTTGPVGCPLPQPRGRGLTRCQS
jgi:hypothetical protein